MSLAPLSPIISDWIALGLEWKYIWQPRYAPKTIPAKGQLQLPRDDFTYTYPEGVLLTFGGIFDHPTCGVKFITPQLDTGEVFTSGATAAGGLANQPFFLFAPTPPATPAGVYGIGLFKAWAWEDTIELYLINTDSIDHRVLGFAYTMAVLMKPRKDDPTLNIKKLRLALELYPELKETIKKKLTQAEINRLIRKVKL